MRFCTLNPRPLALCAAFLCVACDPTEETGQTPPPAPRNHRPIARLSASPTSGLAPLLVTLDPSASTDADADELLARFDFDGDGTWDTTYGTLAPTTHRFAAGTYRPRVGVMDIANAGSEATLEVDIVATSTGEPLADLVVDTNRDGTLGFADDAGEELYGAASGAIFLANVDDDDGDAERDGLDSVVNGAGDLEDLALVRVVRVPELASGHNVTIEVTPEAAAARVQLFAPSGAGYTLIHAPSAGVAVVPTSELATSDLDLRLEARTGRTAGWDGKVILTLQISNGTVVLSEDTVELRVAPTIFPDNVQPPAVLYVMRIPDPRDRENLAFFDALVAGLPEGVSLYDVDVDQYAADRWVQDNMQVGYQEIPQSGGRRTLRTFLEVQRPTGWGGLEYFVGGELLDGARGYLFPGGSNTSHNYGGNLEVAPPHDGFPLGRILVGGGSAGSVTGTPNTDRMASAQRTWLTAQEVQAPLLELSSEWLAVGHIDEIFQFIPDPAQTNGKPYKVVFASPDLARAGLLALDGIGLGAAVVFANRPVQTTVDAILADTDLLAFNDAVQARIDSVRDVLATAMALDDADILDLPVLYEPVFYDGVDFAVAYNPGVQNLTTVGELLFIPDPEGPNGPGGVDVWQQQIVQALTPLGVAWEFVDVFESYHLLMGEAHCGTNVEQAAYPAAFWEL